MLGTEMTASKRTRRKSKPSEMEVTAIQPVASDPSRRRIMIGATIVATLRDEDVDRLGIQVGMLWTVAMQAQSDGIQQRIKARTRAMSLLGRRSYSRGEIIERLERAGFETPTCLEVADELVQQGWIDETTLAKHAARAISKHVYSRDAITERLRDRQLADDLAEQAAEQALEGVDLHARATDYIRKKLGKRVSRPAERDLARILGGLARKGFEPDLVQKAFRDLGIDVDEQLDSSQA